MLRRALLVALVCLSAWAAADRVGAFSRETADAAANATSSQLAAPDEPDRSDRQWEAARRTTASLTPSAWKAQLHHAERAGLDGPDASGAGRAAVTGRPTRHTPHHLHSIPLLI